MRLQAYLLLLVSIPNFILGSFILLRNIKDRVNIFFALLAYSVGLWALGLSGFILTDDATIARYWAQEYYVAAALIAITFLCFCLSFTGRWSKLSALKIAGLVLPALLFVSMLLFLPDLMITSIAYHSWGKSVDLNSFVYVLYGAYFVLYVVPGFRVVFRRRKIAKGMEQIYLRYIFYGFLFAFILGATFNLFLPALGNYEYVWVGPLFTPFYVAFMSYAIIRHRLFDIRLVVARSLAYILSIVSLAVLFGLVAFILINQFVVRGGEIPIGQQLLYTVLAVTIAFTFQPIKRFFDKITNRAFYRDAYDPQQLLDSLNKTLVSTIDLKLLLSRVSLILTETIKADFGVFDIKESTTAPERVVSSPEVTHISRTELSLIQKEAPNLKKKVLLTDELEDHPKLQKVLRDNNIALVAHLVDLPTQNQPGLGYLLMGNKKSGNPYSSEDVHILEIITDELVIAVQNALRFDEIKDFNVTLQQRVDDATRKLRRTNEKLKQLDETKDDFISMASHQLRTPLTSVKGYVSMVLEGDAGKVTPQQQKLLDQAFVSSQRMVFLIADLLNVSRLKTGKFVIEPKPTNLAEIVGGEIDQLVETAKSRDLTLTYQKPHDFPLLNLDETKTRQVIMNFVDNAIYYTPAGGHITVNLVDKPESIEFTVVDDGLGVPKHEQPHLFTKFFRANNAKKARPDGTGLGLFMAKKVIIAQGGAILFKSQENKGSTFGFSFPKNKLLIK